MTKLPYADKELGQHFLRDQKVIDTICQNFKDKADVIIEVGPGPGILTKHLKEYNIPFYVIEKDPRFPEYLKEYVAEENIYLRDALQFDFNELIQEKQLKGKKIWLVSNLPYNISAPLTVKFLEIPEIKYMTLMYQKEVARKIVPTQKNEMNSLLTLCQNYFTCKHLINVAPGAFQPPPKVDSAVISFERNETPSVSLERFDDFESFLRTIFSNRRKQVSNVLKQKYESAHIENVFKNLNLKLTARSESFTLQDIINIYKEFTA